jgi:hypothetical protein
MGLFSMIDEEINVPKGCDESFLSKALSAHSRHPRFERARPKIHKDAGNCFVVKHYAGDVAYNVKNFLDKNKDSISDVLNSICRTSENPFVAEVMSASKKGSTETSDDSSSPKKKSPVRRGAAPRKAQMTLGSQFKQQLNDLMNLLGTTDPHFVRCMKPNAEKVGSKYTSEMMLSQLRYAGLVEVCRIRQTGYPIRKPYDKFYKQYLPLAPTASSVQELIETITAKGALQGGQWARGTTKLFLKHVQALRLDALRDKALSVQAIQIQKIARGYVSRWRLRMAFQAIEALKAAVHSRTKVQLEEALGLSAEIPYGGSHLPLVRFARALYQRIVEEARVEELLRSAIRERALALLEGALRIAMQMEPPLASPVVGEVHTLIEVVKKEKTVLKDAQSALNSRYASNSPVTSVQHVSMCLAETCSNCSSGWSAHAKAISRRQTKPVRW